MEHTVQGVIEAGGIVTRFARAGVGPPVILLQNRSLEELLSDRLFSTLAREYRVTVPEMPPEARKGRIQANAWLGDVLEGLGLENPRIVATGDAERLLRDFLRTRSAHFAELVLLPDDPFTTFS